MVHHRRPAKRRRLSRPPFHILPFSSFARALSLFSSAPKRRRADQPPAPKTRRTAAQPSSSSSSSSASSSSDEEDQQEMEMVQADFGFFDPKPTDFSGVKLLLQRYLNDKPWDLSGFVDLILEQTTVGTIIKLDGDDDEEGDTDAEDSPYGVISSLNLKRYGDHRCIGELKNYILDACTDEVMKKELKILLEGRAGEVGILVSQRFVNCPYELVPHLYDGLFDEIEWATEDEPTQELRDSFRFKFYALVTRIYMNNNVNQCKKRTKSVEDEPIIYIKAEDEIFHELSTLSFTFRLQGEQSAPLELKNYREMGLVMVVKADDVPKFREKLKSLIYES